MNAARARKKSPLRRIFGALAAGALLAPAFSGCGAGFDGQSRVEGLRVLAVVADKPYAKVGEDITFTMTYYDAVSQTNPDTGGRNIEILWLGGCFDPLGDYYYGCYESFQGLFDSLSGLEPGGPLPAELEGRIGIGPSFTLTNIPEDIVSRRPVPESGPHYGIAYVFFTACAGHIRPVPIETDASAAGSFPIGCFDDDGNRLGADSFVPGYTQVFFFEDERANENPKANGMRIRGSGDKDWQPLDVTAKVDRCGLSDDERKALGCGNDPFEKCQGYDIDVMADKHISEIDPEGQGRNGQELHEPVWVDYYADGGTFSNDVKLIYDSTTGIVPDHSTKWLPPPEKGTVTLWAVVHDARGGSSVLERHLIVE